MQAYVCAGRALAEGTTILRTRHTQKLSSLLFTTLISISIITLAHKSMAQTSAAPSKTGTRLITLGTSGGPSPKPDRAQSSNLLTVNGTH
jgi:hypothetical protein